MITIKLNGKESAAEQNITVMHFLELNNIDPYQVVTELNLEILNPDKLAGTVLKEGDSLEVLRFVGGG